MIEREMHETAPMPGMKETVSLELDWIDRPGQFEALEAEWNELVASDVDTVFLTHWWLASWWQFYGAGNQMWVITARHRGRLVGAAPLMLQPGWDGIRRLVFIGVGEANPNHLDVIACPDWRDAVLRRLAGFLTRTSSHWDMLELDKLPGESNTPRYLRQKLSEAGLATDIETSARCPYIQFPDSFEEYLKSGGHYSSKRNRLQRLSPPPRFLRVETVEKLDPAMSALIRMHQARWTEKGYSGSFSTDRFVQFHRTVALRALQAGQLRLYVLEADSGPVAIEYAFRTGDQVQGYLASFDAAWSKYSPGMLIMTHAFEQSMAEGASRFDLLEGEESYKDLWATGVRDNLRLRAYSPSWRGRLGQARTLASASLLDWGVRHVPVHIRRPLWQAILRLKSRMTF